MIRKSLVSSLLCFSTLMAAPKGFEVKSGKAHLSQNNHEWTVSNSKDAIIHWESFSIDPHEVIQFMQESGRSRVLNRVIGNEVSQIYGALKSNGQVYLINQNGILIGPSGRIEAAGFIGSTLDLKDLDFLNGGDLLFQNLGNGKVINLGTIQATSGDITLIARSIDNQGTLQAKGGHVSLGAGVEILLRPEGDERISIRSKEILPNGEEEIAIENLGDIEALYVEMKSAKNPYEIAIHTSGRIRALSRKEENGRVFLVASEGKNVIDRELSAPGGEVHLLGDEVVLEETALVDVSERSSGGTVLVGGDYRGSNPQIQNAKKVTLKKGSEIYADAIENGDGGRVITWGDEANHFYGRISAQGGKEGGDGGFVEVSAKSSDWHFKGEVTTNAPKGKSGTLLLDPTNINVTAAASNPAFPTGGPGVYNPTTLTPATLNVADVVNALDVTGTNVIINTTSGLAGAGTVTFSSNLTWATDHSLTVFADQNIIVGADLASTFVGAPTNNPLVNFLANPTSLSGNFDGVRINSGASVTTVDGSVYMEGRGGTQDENDGIHILTTAVISSSGNGAITLIGDGQNIGPGNNKEGIRVNGRVEVTNGLLTMNGNGGNGNFSQGIELNVSAPNLPGTIVSTGTGNMEITGIGGPSPGNRSTGLVLANGTSIRALGSGSIDILAVGEGTANLENGIEFFPGSGTCTISTVSGDIDIIAQGSTTGTTDCHGISMLGTGQGSFIETESGAITINATGNGGGPNHGIFMNGPNAAIRVINNGPGTITINASTNAAGLGSQGVNIINQASIETVSGALYVNGIGGPNGGDSFGVGVIGLNSRIESDSGSVTVIGQENLGTQEGVLLRDFGRIFSNTGPITTQSFGNLVMEDGFIESDGTVLADSNLDILMTATFGNTYIRSNTSTTTAIADRNIIMNSNLPFISEISSEGDVAVVVDDAFPAPPGIGPGFIFKDADSVISSVSGRARVFTARQPLNTIIGNINGAPFVPGIQYVDTLQERWCIYYFDPFNGLPFTVFYKDCLEDTVITLVNDLMIANTTLSVEYLPFFPRVPTPFTFRYIGDLCNYWSHKLQCRPNFSPYGSFIYSDEIYWIGERWDTPNEEELREYLEQNYGK